MSKFLTIVLCFCLAMGATACSQRGEIKESSSLESPPSSEASSIASQTDNVAPSEASSTDSQTFSQVEQNAPEQRSLTYVDAEDVTDYNVEQIRDLISQLLDKALTICVLGDCQDYDQDSKERETDSNGNVFVPVLNPQYNSTEEIREDMYTTFTKTTADTQFSYMFNSIYRDYNNKLYCTASATGYRKIHQWNLDTLQIMSLTDDKITVNMDCTVIDDTFIATLEAIKIGGHWVLNDTYFAYAQ